MALEYQLTDEFVMARSGIKWKQKLAIPVRYRRFRRKKSDNTFRGINRHTPGE